MTSGGSIWLRISPTACAYAAAPSAVDAPSGITKGIGHRRARPGSAASSIAAGPIVSCRDVANLGAQQLVQQRIGGGRRRRDSVRHQNAAQTELGGHRGGRACVIGLHAPARDQRVRAFGARARCHELQLASLLPPKPNAIASSRLVRIAGSLPIAARSRGSSSTGVLPPQRATRGNASRRAALHGRQEGVTSEPIV